VAGGLPPGLRVAAPLEALTRCFPALAALQPVRWTAAGLVCAPRAAPELAGPAIAACPLPLVAEAEVPGWPDPPSDWSGGFYRRSPAHAPAPAGVREVLQVPGEGFGAGEHPTSSLCLAALPGLPAGPALDVGCGSGVLSLAWVALGRGPVLAVDLDHHAAAQARRAVAAAGHQDLITVRHGPLEALAAGEIAGRVVLANMPPAAHRALLARVAGPPRAAVLSGLRPGQARELLAAWRRHGLVPAAAARRRRWERWTLLPRDAA
jgi:hypothetical protein